jgi:solute:Na+ symporter, SSS family
VFSHLLQTKPGWVTLARGTAPYGTVWYISTVMLNSLGAFMFPQSIQSIFSARDESTVRRNMIFLPIYNVVIVLMLFAGFTALLVAPGLQGPAVDRSFVMVVQRYFPAWVVGLVCGAGCLAALLPASVLLLGAATVISRNVAGHTRWVRPAVLACAALSFVLWFFARATLVDLLLFVYNGITQLVPGVLLGLVWKRVTAIAVWAGLIAGEAIAAYAVHAATGPAGVNSGLIALFVNAAVCVLVTLGSPRSSKDEEFSDNAARPSEILG